MPVSASATPLPPLTEAGDRPVLCQGSTAPLFRGDTPEGTDIQTTMKTTMIYVHHVPADDAAQRLAGAVQRSGDFLFHENMKRQAAPSGHSRSHHRPEGVLIEDLDEAGEAEPAGDLEMCSLARTTPSARWNPVEVDSLPTGNASVTTSDQIPQNRDSGPGNVRPPS